MDEPTSLIFYPMEEGQGWYVVGVYPNGGRQTLAEFSSKVGLDLARMFAELLVSKFGLTTLEDRI